MSENYGRLVRLKEIVDRKLEFDLGAELAMFSPDELDQIVEDSAKLFTPEAARLIAALARQARLAVE